MDSRSELPQVLEQAVAKVLRALFRVLLRHAMSFTAFEELAKRVYVEVAMQEFGIAGKKPSISRASILSGLTRKEVGRLLAAPPDVPATDGGRYNRAARVLTAWLREIDYLDAAGEPRALEVEGERGFAELVRRHSGDMPVRAVLDELLRVGAVQRLADQRVALLARAYVPAHSASDKLDILGQDVADLIATIDHNIQHGAQAPRFQRKVMYHRVPAQALPALRRLGAEQGQRLLERLDAWLQAHGQTSSRADGADAARVGLGIYYFEEPEAGPASGLAQGEAP